MQKKMKVGLVGLVAGLMGLTACSGGSNASTGSSGSGTELNLVGYSVLQQANVNVIKGFQATSAGKNVTFKQSYGASGDQSRAVEAGQKADIVHFSLEPDVTRLVTDGIVPSSWKNNSTKGV